MHESFDIAKYFPEIDQISDPALAAAVTRVWNRLWQESTWESIEDLPVAPNIPYSHIRHAQSTVRAVLAVTDIFIAMHQVDLDRDLIIAAAILQDVSKLVEYRPDQSGGVEQTDLGKRLQHAFYAAHVALDEGLPLDVVHAILTHSTQSSMPPRTKEARILSLIDRADAAAITDGTHLKRIVMEHAG